jgi:hypothetical protein
VKIKIFERNKNGAARIKNPSEKYNKLGGK